MLFATNLDTIFTTHSATEYSDIETNVRVKQVNSKSFDVVAFLASLESKFGPMFLLESKQPQAVRLVSYPGWPVPSSSSQLTVTRWNSGLSGSSLRGLHVLA